MQRQVEGPPPLQRVATQPRAGVDPRRMHHERRNSFRIAATHPALLSNNATTVGISCGLGQI
ncbi:hypothetical protein NG01_02975 [Corynebacterium diphtheriae]|nr:hypothetical protein NG01_02975 [Corynebacterium diphtheriae]